MNSLLAVSPEVEAALATGLPVVALETTVVTHGLPHSLGVEVALELESLIRERGAVPATVGILDGRARIGISSAELERLASSSAAKVNLGNLAPVLAAGEPGSTTVAATMVLAHLAGIGVFATGGIGGVHRGAERTGDVSADLTALARFPVTVVCAGAKAVLDLPRTLESLETRGVPVLGYTTDTFPAFYRRDSGLPVDARCDTVLELARVIRIHLALGRQTGRATGILVSNPIPPESEMPEELYENALAETLSALEREPARGRFVTPFLLDRINRATHGRSVACNRALLTNNAELAARLALELTGERE